MKAKITKIYQGKISRNGDQVYYRLRFEIFDDQFKSLGYAMTDIVPGFRNFVWWKEAIAGGAGTWLSNISCKIMPQEKKIGKVDGDSQVIIINPPPQVGSNVEPGPKVEANALHVQSQSNPDQEYKIVRTDLGWECSCPAFTYCKTEPKTCKHIKARQSLREQPKIKPDDNWTKMPKKLF